MDKKAPANAYVKLAVGDNVEPGLTKMQHASIQMMAAILANPNSNYANLDVLAKTAFDAAEALFKVGQNRGY